MGHAHDVDMDDTVRNDPMIPDHNTSALIGVVVMCFMILSRPGHHFRRCLFEVSSMGSIGCHFRFDDFSISNWVAQYSVVGETISILTEHPIEGLFIFTSCGFSLDVSCPSR